MTRISQVKYDLQLAKRLKVAQDFQVDKAHAAWLEELRHREEIKQCVQRLLQELWRLQGGE
jgi:hypothetical protein